MVNNSFTKVYLWKFFRLYGVLAVKHISVYIYIFYMYSLRVWWKLKVWVLTIKLSFQYYRFIKQYTSIYILSIGIVIIYLFILALLLAIYRYMRLPFKYSQQICWGGLPFDFTFPLSRPNLFEWDYRVHWIHVMFLSCGRFTILLTVKHYYVYRIFKSEIFSFKGFLSLKIIL